MLNREPMKIQLERLWDKLLSPASDAVALPRSTFSKDIPWGAWELDRNFFSALPKIPLHRLIAGIIDGLQQNKDIDSLIPGAPSSARNLLIALAHLLRLGMDVSRLEEDVQAFVKGFTQWVENIGGVFKRRMWDFPAEAWACLSRVRDLVDEICNWATARLEDNGWMLVKNDILVSKQVDDFRMQLTSAQGVFDKSTVANLVRAQKEVLRKLGDVRQAQIDHSSQLSEDKKQRAQAVWAADTQTRAQQQYLDKMLSTFTAPNITYGSQEKHPCDAGTRIKILEDIESWVYDISGDAQRFLWLTGDPGSGKSAIAASVTCMCKNKNILLAQFFIDRNNDATTNPANLFSSIVYQLANFSPGVLQAVYDALKAQPSLVDDIFHKEAEKLVVNTLKVASAIDQSKPVVIVLDGLDEIGKTHLSNTADMISRVLTDLPCNIKIFISSRMEDEITKPLSEIFSLNQVKHVHLDISVESSTRDVRQYLVHSMVALVQKYGLNSVKWLDDKKMDQLCTQASGLFIWAVTAVRFIESEIKRQGGLSIYALGELINEDIKDINMLYQTVLKITCKEEDSESEQWVYEVFCKVIGCIITLKEPLSVGDINMLLTFQHSANGYPIDVVHFIRRMQMLLVDRADKVTSNTILRPHRVFVEFIRGQLAGKFQVDHELTNTKVGLQCLQYISWWDGTEDKTSSFPLLLDYSWKFWSQHLTHGQAGLYVVDPDSSYPLGFDSKIQTTGSIHIGSAQNAKLVISSSKDLYASNRTLFWSSRSNLHFLRPLRGHTKSVSALAFSSNGKCLASGSYDKSICLWNFHTGKPTGLPFLGHTSRINCISFSPDEKHIASGSDDGEIHLSDINMVMYTAEHIADHGSRVLCIAYSPDGSFIVSGSADCTLQLLDVVSGLTEKLFGHHGPIQSISFSPDGSIIVSGSDDKSLLCWNMETRSVVQQLHGHNDRVLSVAFSPDGNYIVSGAANGEIYLWSKGIKKLDIKLSTSVQSLAFSPIGNKEIIVASGNSISILDYATYKFIESSSYGYTDASSVVFSADGKHVASGSKNKTIHLWQIVNSTQIDPQFDQIMAQSTCFSISPDGLFIIFVSGTGWLYWWDTLGYEFIGEPVNAGGVVSLAFSPDNSQVATLFLDGSISLYSSEKGHNCLHTLDSFQGQLTGVENLVFSGDGNQLMLFQFDKFQQTWDTTTGEFVEPSGVPISEPKCVKSFGWKEGWSSGKATGAKLWWFPVKHLKYGIINGKIIRSDHNHMTSVFYNKHDSARD